jgi:hypothetical protein
LNPVYNNDTEGTIHFGREYHVQWWRKGQARYLPAILLRRASGHGKGRIELEADLKPTDQSEINSNNSKGHSRPEKVVKIHRCTCYSTFGSRICALCAYP